MRSICWFPPDLCSPSPAQRSPISLKQADYANYGDYGDGNHRSKPSPWGGASCHPKDTWCKFWLENDFQFILWEDETGTLPAWHLEPFQSRPSALRAFQLVHHLLAKIIPILIREITLHCAHGPSLLLSFHLLIQSNQFCKFSHQNIFLGLRNINL